MYPIVPGPLNVLKTVQLYQIGNADVYPRTKMNTNPILNDEIGQTVKRKNVGQWGKTRHS